MHANSQQSCEVEQRIRQLYSILDSPVTGDVERRSCKMILAMAYPGHVRPNELPWPASAKCE